MGSAPPFLKMLFLLTKLNFYGSCHVVLMMLYCSNQLLTLVIVFLYSRMSAVAYLSSYLSRAKFLSAALVTGIIKRYENILCLLLLMTKSIFIFYNEFKKLI